MENETKEPKTYLNYGIPFGIVLIVLFVIYYVFALYTNRALVWLPTIVFFILIIVAQINHAKALGGNITYGNLFANGFKTTCAATAIYVLFLIIFLLLVPAYKDQVMEYTRQQMVQKGLQPDQINTALIVWKKAFMVTAIGGAIVGELLTGVIASLIGAAIAKKNPQPQNSLI